LLILKVKISVDERLCINYLKNLEIIVGANDGATSVAAETFYSQAG
jgi:hypothetical protein